MAIRLYILLFHSVLSMQDREPNFCLLISDFCFLTSEITASVAQKADKEKKKACI